jgi:hypothetical protein
MVEKIKVPHIISQKIHSLMHIMEKKNHIVTFCRCMLRDIAIFFETNNNLNMLLLNGQFHNLQFKNVSL